MGLMYTMVKYVSMLNTVILSDLHFGDPYSVLHDQGVPSVLDLIKVHAEGHLRRLVLAGDIFEMTTPESRQARQEQSRFFFAETRGRLRLGEVIWVPGNHDYTLFRQYVPDPVLFTGGNNIVSQ